jgi:Protein of unknown function (DUF3309)
MSHVACQRAKRNAGRGQPSTRKAAAERKVGPAAVSVNLTPPRERAADWVAELPPAVRRPSVQRRPRKPPRHGSAAPHREHLNIIRQTIPTISHEVLLSGLGCGTTEEINKMLSTILIILLILLLIGALPTWPYSAGWGYGPGGALGAVLVIVLILALLGQI